ncbi:MAG TPA: hypothetical protein VNS22_08950 [Geminicoccus sp.]|uniref:hypothetical protein n=1 Tax=Geminicoccus sp. TaxID=2024832 RepID=UPI002CE9AE8D|nr:hypothetical protein [Geminicoccus sp.]HWL68497.1 hypothetical protein [Geminicoccus sp.]
MSSKQPDRNQGDHARPRPPTPLLEWVAAGLGAAVAIFIVGYLAWDGLTGADAPADLVIRVDGVEAATAGFRVDLIITNLGGETAAEARIAVTAATGEEQEAGEITFDYVPGHSSRRGSLLFRNRPDPAALTARVLGFREP